MFQRLDTAPGQEAFTGGRFHHEGTKTQMKFCLCDLVVKKIVSRRYYVDRGLCRHSGYFRRLIGDSSFRDYLDLFKFRSFKAKKSCHIDDLIQTYEIIGLRAESLYTRSKLAALHCFRSIQAKAAYAFLGAK